MVGTPIVTDSSDSSDSDSSTGELPEIADGDGEADDDNEGDENDNDVDAAPAHAPAPAEDNKGGRMPTGGGYNAGRGLRRGMRGLVAMIFNLGTVWVALLLMLFGAQRSLLFPAPPNPLRCDAGRSYIVPIPTAGRPAGVSVLGVSVLEYRAMAMTETAAVESKGVTVVFFHANGDQNGWGPCQMGAYLATLGIHFVSVEYPGYGLDAAAAAADDNLPTPYPSEAGILFAAKGVLQQLGRPNEAGDVATRRVILMGQSIGTAVAVGLAADPELRKTNPNIEGALLIAPFLSIPKVAATLFPVPSAVLELLVKDPFDSEARAVALAAAPAPPPQGAEDKAFAPAPFRWLVMHGTEDKIVPYEHGKRLAATLAAAGGHDVVFKPLKGAGHTDIFSRPQMKVFDLIERFAFATTASA